MSTTTTSGGSAATRASNAAASGTAANDLEARLSEQPGEPLPEERRVVGDRDAQDVDAARHGRRLRHPDNVGVAASACQDVPEPPRSRVQQATSRPAAAVTGFRVIHQPSPAMASPTGIPYGGSPAP